MAFSLFDRVVAVSEAQANWMTSRNLIERTKLVTIQSCIDLTPFQSIPAAQGLVQTFGAIGRLDRQKGFDLLIGAFRSLPDPSIRLKIIGTGPQEEVLRKLAGADTRIEFIGFCADPARAYQGIDAVVMPSRWEAFGLVAIEALASGRPLLCARVDGLCDHAEHGSTYFGSFTQASLACALDDMARRARTTEDLPVQFHASQAMERFQVAWTQIISSTLSAPQGTPTAAINAPA